MDFRKLKGELNYLRDEFVCGLAFGIKWAASLAALAIVFVGIWLILPPAA